MPSAGRVNGKRQGGYIRRRTQRETSSESGQGLRQGKCCCLVPFRAKTGSITASNFNGLFFELKFVDPEVGGSSPPNCTIASIT